MNVDASGAGEHQPAVIGRGCDSSDGLPHRDRSVVVGVAQTLGDRLRALTPPDLSGEVAGGVLTAEEAALLHDGWSTCHATVLALIIRGKT